MKKNANQKVLVLVQRHLALETSLAASLESLNEATAALLAKRGLKGPEAEDVAVLEPMTKEVQVANQQVAIGRVALLEKIDSEFGFSFSALSDLIDEFGFHDSLNGSRAEILRRCEKAQSSLISNQASLHYTFDFHRKYLSGVFHHNTDRQNYRPDGQSQDPPTGNLFGRTC
jgi:hypothetical protein